MGPYLSTPIKDKKTISGSNNRLAFAASEMQGWRNTMEDAHINRIDLPNDISVFGVFDGHGGKEVAYFVERHFIEHLVANPSYKNNNFDQALTETFIKMDELLQTEAGQKEIQAIKGNNDESYAGCTANVALLYKNFLYVANSGDSRTLLCRNGQPVELSIDHKPDQPAERARIEKAGGFVSDGRVNGNLNLSRAMGDLEYKKDTKLKPQDQLISVVPEITKTELGPQDTFFLMGCDGIWETLSNVEILKVINDRIKTDNSPKNLEKTVEELLDKLIAPDTTIGTGCDNMSAVLVVLKK